MPKSSLPARRRDEDALLEQLQNGENLEQLVPQLPTGALLRVIEARGLEDCGDLIALASPAQLQQVFDHDLWRSLGPGEDEQLDAERFGIWLDVLAGAGVEMAAQKLAAIDPEVIIAALAQQLRVSDVGAGISAGDGPTLEIGGYLIEATPQSSWDSIVAILLQLDGHHQDAFHRLMIGCRRLSNSTPEIDGLHSDLLDHDQHAFDLAIDRHQRRERAGFVSPAQARAFLTSARDSRHADRAAAAHTIRAEYFRDYLGTGLTTRLDPEAIHAEEFAFLANTLLAGCAVSTRAFTADEASAAVTAICQLGTELTGEAGPTTAFVAGWAALYNDVAMYVAAELLAILPDVPAVSDDTQVGLDTLRRELMRQWRAGTPWLAAESLDVIIILDKPAWAMLLALIAECPVILDGALRRPTLSIRTNAFDFFSTKAQIAAVREFCRTLPEALTVA